MSDLGFKCADTDLGRKLHLESAIGCPRRYRIERERRKRLERAEREERFQI